MQNSQALLELIATVHRLRAPGGCPWDRAQTHQSLRQYLIEEAYEVLDVLDRIDSAEVLADQKIRDSFKEELGDLLMQILIHAEIAGEEGAFDIHDIARALNEKLIRRHPHVFGDFKVDTPAAALKQWEKQKAHEKKDHTDASLLAGMPRALPALQRATRVIEKVTRVGFQWKELQGPLDKIDEELDEWKAEIKKGLDAPDAKAALEHELGDLLFSICNVSYLMKIEPEVALRKALERFGNRFGHIEKTLAKRGRSPEESSLEEMDELWNEAKEAEKKRQL